MGAGKELRSLAGNRRAAGTHTGSLSSWKINSRGTAACGPCDQRCRARPGRSPAPVTKSPARIGCGKGKEERGIPKPGTLALKTRVDPGGREGHLWPSHYSSSFVDSSPLTPNLQSGSSSQKPRGMEIRAPENPGEGRLVELGG